MAATPAEVDDVLPPETDNPVVLTQYHWRLWEDAKRNDSILKQSRHPDALDRLLVAVTLRSFDPPKHWNELNELLNDPDPVVRRAAAETLMGPKEFRKKNHARDYAYESVLKAELQAAVIFKKLEQCEGQAAFDLTRQLIDLGWPAYLEVLGHLDNLKTMQGLNAAYARQEIEAARINVLAPWAERLRLNLEKPVTFDFKDVPIVEAIRRVGAMVEISIIFEKELMPEIDRQKVTIQRNNVKAGQAFESLSDESKSNVVLAYNCSCYFRRRWNVCGTSALLFDVRDIVQAGKIDWADKFKKRFPEFAELIGSQWEARSLREQDGILIFIAPTSAVDWDGRKEMSDSANFLNAIRVERKLKPVPFPIREESLRFK